MIGEVMKCVREVHALLKLKMAAAKLEREMPSEPEDLAFAYSILRKVSNTFAFAIQQLRPHVRDAVKSLIYPSSLLNLSKISYNAFVER